ncbi:hypothetical protein [Desulfomarina sp.]
MDNQIMIIFYNTLFEEFAKNSRINYLGKLSYFITILDSIYSTSVTQGQDVNTFFHYLCPAELAISPYPGARRLACVCPEMRISVRDQGAREILPQASN